MALCYNNLWEQLIGRCKTKTDLPSSCNGHILGCSRQAVEGRAGVISTLERICRFLKRAFYEREAAERNWSFRQLERMYRTSTFERLQISNVKVRGSKRVQELAA